jgi:hypothetical protein
MSPEMYELILYQKRPDEGGQLVSPRSLANALGGCIISPDSPKTDIGLVCSDCHDAAKEI